MDEIKRIKLILAQTLAEFFQAVSRQISVEYQTARMFSAQVPYNSLKQKIGFYQKK